MHYLTVKDHTLTDSEKDQRLVDLVSQMSREPLDQVTVAKMQQISKQLRQLEQTRQLRTTEVWALIVLDYFSDLRDSLGPAYGSALPPIWHVLFPD